MFYLIKKITFNNSKSKTILVNAKDLTKIKEIKK